jgi:hypothetical protein
MGNANRIAMRRLLIVCVFVGSLSSVNSQNRETPDSAKQPTIKVYTAKFKIETMLVETNGTTTRRESTELLAQDSQGRRLVATIYKATEWQPERTDFIVIDEAAGIRTTWATPGTKVLVDTTHRPVSSDQPWSYCWVTEPEGEAAPPPLAPAMAETPSDPILLATKVIRPPPVHFSVIEDLGTETIEGLEAQGSRATLTIAAGEMGKNAPQVSAHEKWFAPAIGMVIREISEMTGLEQRTKELVEFSADEPDPSLFEPPADYKLVKLETHQVPCGQ